jgi:hypothetical protein
VRISIRVVLCCSADQIAYVSCQGVARMYDSSLALVCFKEGPAALV